MMKMNIRDQQTENILISKYLPTAEGGLKKKNFCSPENGCFPIFRS
jgi:hypothetical protein